VSDDVLHGIGEDPNQSDPNRRRSLSLLLVLFVAAGLVAIFMSVVNGTGKRNTAAPPPSLNGPVVTSHSPSIANDITSTINVPTESEHPVRPVNPFGTTQGGDVVDAVNALRVVHHLTPVAGATSIAATLCAQQQGRGSACEPHFIYAAVGTKDGTLGVQRVQAFNSTWLLDPTTTRIAYGWSQTGSQYYLAILKWP
jgi:hypothetical protein